MDVDQIWLVAGPYSASCAHRCRLRRTLDLGYPRRRHDQTRLVHTQLLHRQGVGKQLDIFDDAQSYVKGYRRS